ncbi:hypothetical protein GUJ93_ZPchr0013g33765 [Zizania palustris]|uniref:COP1-interacting protein 7 n=1 Tax=Zizania palustris TaxID=103762 RepID=A0A8J6BXI5_ZIZPA|nr:hypothetical protein GUJ93_ZPchr0013g33765 [Zizania palustris]
MEPDAPLDFALFQLSPRRSRCELVVSGNGRTEKIASGSVKPFVAHLRAAEEQAAAQPPPPAIRLQLERRAAWFSKGTLERFVRFVSTPDVLEMANTFDVEMSQLEGARQIYAQGVIEGAISGGAAENVTESAAAADITKKELLRAIDVRLSALKQDLVMACARASSAGFNPDSVSELVLFADHFGSNRLSEACNKFMSLCQRRPDICPHYSPPSTSSQWKSFDNGNVRGSSSSDMSLDEIQADQGASSNKSIPPPELSTVQHSKPTIQQTVEKQEDAPPAPAGGISRRLSVKDRINMFENKQQEQTSNSGNNSACTGKVVPGKGEHRRVPSAASMDKLVRRWSSVSDMSIDLSNNDSSSLNEKKENGTPVGTPTSANLEGNSKARPDQDASGLKHPVTSCQKDNLDALPMVSTATNVFSTSTLNVTSPSSLSAVVSSSPQKQTRSSVEDDMVMTSSIESESSFRKEVGANQGQGDMSMLEHTTSNVPTRARPKASPRPAEVALPEEDNDTLNSSLLSEEHVQMMDKEIISVSHEVTVTKEQIVQKDNRGSRVRSKEIHAEEETIGRKDRRSRTVGKISGGVDPKSRAMSNPRVNMRGPSGRDDAVCTETEVHDVNLKRKSLPRKAEDAGRKVATSSEIPPQSDYSGRQGTNLSRQSSYAEHELSLHGGKIKSVSDGKAIPLDQTRVMRPSKGSQDRHDELQMKANELEKLFAEHKLSSSRRGKSSDVQVDNTPKVSEANPLVLPEMNYTKRNAKESISNDFDANELLKMVDNEGYNNDIPQKLDILSLEESRGKFYDQYVQKRDAKLKEDWKMQREQKEAAIKAMRDSLERSNAEMRAKFSRSSDVPGSTYVSCCTQKFPPLQSVIKDKDQGIDSFLVEEETNSDYLSGDGSSRSADSRKHFSNKVASTQKTSAAPVRRHSSRTVNSAHANRRNLPENPLAQSVPNFIDLRKENTKPGLSRAAARTQPKSFSRSKSIIEESKSISKDQSRKSQSMRKNLSPSELRDTSSANDVTYNWGPSRISKDQVEGAFNYSTHKADANKSFLRKGNETHPAVGIAGFRPPMFANTFHNGEDDDFLDQQEDSPDETKDEEYESIEENLRESDFPADLDSENPGINHEFGNSDDPGSENDDTSFPSEAPTLGGTKFNAFAGNMHDTPGELPPTWSSRPHLFPYANDNTYGDAFVDSPNGSPSPWNSHSLDQITDADVSRMRKKWGSAQMPFVVPNASQQPRKDVTKGFKKLLKFGRKNRGGDGLINDWVSASTASECDDDMEDGRDLAMGSSDDFRKSRMGYLSSHDGFVDNDVFAEQEPLRSAVPNPPASFRLRERINSLGARFKHHVRSSPAQHSEAREVMQGSGDN